MHVESSLSIRKQLEGLRKLVDLLVVHLEGPGHENEEGAGYSAYLDIMVIDFVDNFLEGKRLDLLLDLFKPIVMLSACE